MMEPEFNWARFKQTVENTSNMHIPPDITFKFEENENEVLAHKWMMATVSPVFNKMFFVSDTKDKNAKELLLKGTTFGAFNITKNAIYGTTSMENGLKGKFVLEVFSVLDLVTRYQISELQRVVRNHLNSLTLTDDTVLEVAATAMEKASTFEDEARQLLILCAKFLKAKLENAQAVFEYVAAHRDDMETVHELLALMKDIDIGPIASSVCANCRREPCQHGADIQQGQFRKGLIVTSNDNDWWEPYEKDWGEGMVSQVLNDSEVRVKSVKDTFENDDEYEEYEEYLSISMKLEEKCLFKFSCK